MASQTEIPYERPADVIRSLGLLETRMASRGDRRAAFVATYRLTTEAFERRFGTGYFENEAYVSAAVVRIAQYHRVALEAEEDGRTGDVPVVWRRANAAARDRAGGHEVVLLGIIAHVRDLAYVVADLYVAEEQRRQRRDFVRLEAVLCDAIDPIQRYVGRRHDPAFAWADILGLELDEDALCRWLITARNEAWELGARLGQARTDAEREAVRARIEERFLAQSRSVSQAPLLTVLRTR